MPAVVWSNRPNLRSPVLIAAFEGWNDAASSATAAVSFLAQRWAAGDIARIEGERYTDYQGNRPTVHLRDGVVRDIAWPQTLCRATTDAGSGRGAVLVTGPEPNLRWRAFADDLVDVALELGCEMVVPLGALLADVPHSRPVAVTGVTPDGRPLPGSVASRYEGPTGIVGVLFDTCRRRDMPAASLWASVPHYVAGPPNPAATHALLERLAEVTGLDTQASALERAAAEWRSRVDAAVAADEDTAEYVRRLEWQADEEARHEADGLRPSSSAHPSRSERPADRGDSGLADELVSGEALAAELEQFLRDREED